MQLNEIDVQSIVDDLKEVIHLDINFINDKGVMIASTDKKRIGINHPAGLKSIKENRTIIINEHEVNNIYREGINSPITIDGHTVGAISITGKVEKVRSYIDVITRMTQIYLQGLEYEKTKTNQMLREKYIIENIIYQENKQDVYDYLDNFFYDVNSGLYVAIVRGEGSYFELNDLFLMIVNKFDQQIISAVVNNQLVIVCEKNPDLEAMFELCINDAQRLHNILLQVTVGDVVYNNYEIFTSFINAKAIQNIFNSIDDRVVFYENIRLELIIASLNADLQKRILEKTFAKIDLTKQEEFANVLMVYFSENCSIEKSAKKLFIHKNTIQYRLDRFKKITGFNPRVFEEAVYLYIATQLFNLEKRNSKKN